MKTLKPLYLLLLLFMGCRNAQHLLGTDKKEETDRKPNYYVVSCCQDLNNGVLTYPAFLPASQVQLCENVKTADRLNNAHYLGDIYLAMSVDCGRYSYKVGDQYYPKTGY